MTPSSLRGLEVKNRIMKCKEDPECQEGVRRWSRRT